MSDSKEQLIKAEAICINIFDLTLDPNEKNIIHQKIQAIQEILKSGDEIAMEKAYREINFTQLIEIRNQLFNTHYLKGKKLLTEFKKYITPDELNTRLQNFNIELESAKANSNFLYFPNSVSRMEKDLAARINAYTDHMEKEKISKKQQAEKDKAELISQQIKRKQFATTRALLKKHLDELADLYPKESKERQQYCEESEKLSGKLYEEARRPRAWTLDHESIHQDRIVEVIALKAQKEFDKQSMQQGDEKQDYSKTSTFTLPTKQNNPIEAQRQKVIEIFSSAITLNVELSSLVLNLQEKKKYSDLAITITKMQSNLIVDKKIDLKTLLELTSEWEPAIDRLRTKINSLRRTNQNTEANSLETNLSQKGFFSPSPPTTITPTTAIIHKHARQKLLEIYSCLKTLCLELISLEIKPEEQMKYRDLAATITSLISDLNKNRLTDLNQLQKTIFQWEPAIAQLQDKINVIKQAAQNNNISTGSAAGVKHF